MPMPSHLDDVTTGVVYIHAAPAALCPHIEWALNSVLSADPRLIWTAQSAVDGQLRATVEWIGPVGTAARLSAALKAWEQLRFEITEDPSDGCDGERICYVPGLGLWRGQTGANGDIVVSENHLRNLLERPGSADYRAVLDELLGTAWDADLERFRSGGEGAEVMWLSRVG